MLFYLSATYYDGIQRITLQFNFFRIDVLGEFSGVEFDRKVYDVGYFFIGRKRERGPRLVLESNQMYDLNEKPNQRKQTNERQGKLLGQLP